MQIDQRFQVSLLDLGYDIQINEAEIRRKLPLPPKPGDTRKQRSGCVTCLVMPIAMLVGILAIGVTCFGVMGLSMFLPGLFIDQPKLEYSHEFIVQANLFYVSVTLFFPLVGLFFIARSIRKRNEAKNAYAKWEIELTRRIESARSEALKNAIVTFVVLGDKDAPYPIVTG